jgi:hypothetical protein
MTFSIAARTRASRTPCSEVEAEEQPDEDEHREGDEHDDHHASGFHSPILDQEGLIGASAGQLVGLANLLVEGDHATEDVDASSRGTGRAFLRPPP